MKHLRFSRPSRTFTAHSWLILLVTGIALVLPALSQDDESPERNIDINTFKELRKQAQEDATLTEDLSSRILAQYDTAISALENAARSKTQVTVYERERVDTERRVESLRAELDEPRKELSFSIQEGMTTKQVEALLTQERSSLNALRTALRRLQGMVEEQTSRRNEIARILGTLDQQIEAITEQLRTAGQSEAQSKLKEALRYSLAAQRQASAQEINLLRAEMDLLNSRAKLIPWQRDKARRLVRKNEELVAILEDSAAKLRRSEAEESLQRVLGQAQAVRDTLPELSDIASETEGLANQLWGPEGVELRSQLAVARLIAVRKHTVELERLADLTRRQFEAFGRQGNVSRWWPKVPEGFPTSAEIQDEVEERERLIPEVQFGLIQLEQLRAEIGRLERSVDERLADQAISASSDQLKLVKDLLETRRELLDELISQSGRFSSQLVELDTVSRNFLTRVESIEGFMYEKLLWVRSVPKPIIPRPTDMANALLWLIAPQNVVEIWELAAQLSSASIVGIVLLFGLLLGLRPQFLKRMDKLARRVGVPETDRFIATLESLLYTVLLAAPLPLALFLASRFVLADDRSPYLNAAGLALYYTSVIAGLLETTRHLLRPKGLAEAHFRWQPKITRDLHEGLLWPEALFLPLIYVSLHFAWAGIKIDSAEQLQIYNNTLGRVAFIAALLVLGVSLIGILRPRSRNRTIWRKISVIAVPTIVLATVLPALLSAFGYYITGILFAYQMLRTVWLALLLALFAGLAYRWRQTRSLKQSQASSPEGKSNLDTLTEIKLNLRNKEELRVAEVQVQRLNRFVIILIASIGLYSIWADALPVLQALKRVQVWPTIALLESTQEEGPALTTGQNTGAPDSQGDSVKGESGSTGTSSSGITPGLSPMERAVPESGATDTSSLTLWNILKALLAGVITYVLTKNLPGLIELLLLRRTLLDSGARIAASTLVRYVILIFGVSATFSLLGLTWSKIQWLAAALTFGLAFGLQEIVANFVSGLILLVERPIRVGDAVTIGDLQGRVTRTHIRATTITLWDRSEMIVPNKEFITTKLINWTLSDSRRRIDIPVRVAYGSDVQKVKDVLLNVATQHLHVLEEPAPHVLLVEFMEDAMKFELRIFVEFGRGIKTKDELQVGIDQAFKEQSIAFAMPLFSIQLPEGGEKE